MRNEMEVMVTGAGGFVGKALKEYLEQNGCSFTALGLRDDINIPHDMPAAVIHLAGKAHDLEKPDESAAYYAVNTELTKKVFDAFLASDSQVFIMLSSVKAVADSVDGILTEDTPPDPQTHYGKSKLLAEKYISSFTIPPKKRVYILRPCMIHGKGNKGNFNLLYKIARLGLPYPLAAFENERSLLTIDNLCFVILELLKRTDITPGIYNVADNVPVSTKRIMELFAEVLKKKKRFMNMNPSVIWQIAKLGDRFPLPINSERLKKLTENYVVSNRKLINALEKPLPLSADEGLRKTILALKGR